MSEQGFLTALVENPADHVTRKVYADWLEENGDPAKAAFLRDMVAFQTVTGKEHFSLGKEISKAKAAQIGIGSISFNSITRRFDWRLTPDDVLNPANHEALFLYGALATVCITHPGRKMHDLAASPNLRAFTKLEIRHSDENGIQALANSPHSGNLVELSLHRNAIGDAGVQALAASPHLRNLTRLELGHNLCRNAGAIALATSPHLRNLKHLSITYNPIGPEGKAALEASAKARGHMRVYCNRDQNPDQPTPAKGKWSHQVLQDTDRSLSPAIP